MDQLGRIILLIGILITLSGAILMVLGRIPLLRNMGGFRMTIGPITCFFPILASIILSIVLTLILNVILWLVNRG